MSPKFFTIERFFTIHRLLFRDSTVVRWPAASLWKGKNVYQTLCSAQSSLITPTQKYSNSHRGSNLALNYYYWVVDWFLIYCSIIILQGSGTSIMHLVAWFCLNWLILIANLNCLKEQLKCYSDFPHLVPSIISLRGLKSKCVFYWKFFCGEAWSTAVHCSLKGNWTHHFWRRMFWKVSIVTLTSLLVPSFEKRWLRYFASIWLSNSWFFFEYRSIIPW